MMSSEKGLTHMLRVHLKLSGLPDREVTPVVRWDGRSGRTDLHLAAKFQEHDRVRHIIVELKAPDITIGRKELDQVEDYANVLASHPQFSSSTAQWDLILVGTQLDDLVKKRIHKDGVELGTFWGPEPEPGAPRVRAFVRRWRDVIDENKRRLDFLTTVLQHDPSTAEGLGWVRQHFADLLPESLLDPDRAEEA